jgi:hypothetical protein
MRKIIVESCRSCPFFGVSVAAIFTKADGVCGCPSQSGPLHLSELGGQSEADKQARKHLETRRPIPAGASQSVPAWCPLRTDPVAVTLGS